MKMKLFVFVITLSLLLSGMLVAVGGEATDGEGVDKSVKSEPEPTDWADAPWPSFGRDRKNTGRSPYDTTNIDGTKKWNFSTDGGVDSSPAIGPEGTVYVGSNDNKLYAINPDGTLRWSYATGGNVESSPAIGNNGTIYVGSSKLYAINPDGALKWSYTTRDGYNTRYVESSPAIGNNDIVYITASVSPEGGRGYLTNDELYAIYPNGTLKWNYFEGDEQLDLYSPAIGPEGTVYVGSSEGKVYAINPNGTLRWSYTTGGNVESPPTIGPGGTVYVGSNDGKLYAINPNGTLKWSYTTGGNVVSSPAIDSDGIIYFGSDDNNIYSIYPYGNMKWKYSTDGRVRSSPSIGNDGMIYVGSADDNLYVINPDGTEKGNSTTGGDVYSSPAIGKDDTVYVGSSDGNLYAIGGSPSAPRNLESTAGDGHVNLVWDPPLDNGGSNIKEYKIYRGPSSGEESYFDSVDESITSYNDNDLTNGQTYYYKISAVNDDGEGEKSSEVSATPLAVPTTPQNFQATETEDHVKLRWDPPRDEGGSNITKYIIYRGTSPKSLEVYTTVTSLSYTDKYVNDGQIYCYRISAVNSVGEGAKSNEASATPDKVFLTSDWGLVLAIIIHGIIVAIALAIRRKKRFSQYLQKKQLSDVDNPQKEPDQQKSAKQE